MKILHGTWIPDRSSDFVQTGNFYIWVETTETKPTATNRKSTKAKAAPEPKEIEQLALSHPRSLAKTELKSFLFNDLGIKDDLLQEVSNRYVVRDQIVFPRCFLLPTSDRLSSGAQNSQPLPSLELARYLEVEIPETFGLRKLVMLWRNIFGRSFITTPTTFMAAQIAINGNG